MSWKRQSTAVARVSKDLNLGDFLGKRRQASQALRSAKRRWEACWWDDLAAKANQAGEGGNDFLFWQVCRQLGFRDAERSRHGCRRTVANAEQDREAWKTFLRDIQADSGVVSEQVWQFVPQVDAVSQEMSEPPSCKEFDDALKRMKLGKRGGIDDVTVELIRFAGEDLRNVVFEVIQDMWVEASGAQDGHEADKWCYSSRSGVCIPMFKTMATIVTWSCFLFPPS